MSKVTLLVVTLLSLIFYIGCSEDENKDDPEFSTSGIVINVPDGVPETGGLSMTAENAWSFVRQSATWGDANSSIADSILTSLLNSGLLTRAGTYTDTGATINNQSMTIRLTVDSETTVSTAAAYSGAKTFSKKFEIWRNSDNAKAMEMFFDSATTLADDGILMYYKLKVLSPAEFNGDDVIVESYTFTHAEGPKQTYSWSGGAIVSGGSGQAGRVILEEMDSGTVFCFKSVVKMTGSLDWCTAATNSEYYSLGYTQRLDGNGEVTAKFGYQDNGIDNVGELCAVNNTLNYGLFNSTGFVSDGNATVGTEYPLTSRVDALFDEVNTTGAGAWDDTSKPTMDALNIQFVDTAAP